MYDKKEDIYGFPDPYPKVYESIDVLDRNITGWGSPCAMLCSFFGEKSIKTVAEVGVWSGCTSIVLANLLPSGGRVFAVDHWRGSLEQILDPKLSCMLPTLYQQFLSNVIHQKCTDKIIPVRMDSLDAAKKLAELGISLDLIYLDASHDYTSVLADLKTWYPLLAKDGVFCGDDGEREGVMRATTQYAKENNLQIHYSPETSHKRFWYVTPC